MALLDQCSWAHSDPTQVVQGQVFSFAVAVPPLVATGGLVGTVLDTATAATVLWRVTDTATPPNPLVLGDDYQVVSGGLDQMNLAFVVNPSRIAKFSVQPVLSVAGGGLPVVSSTPPVPAAWLPVTYTPIAKSAADLQAAAVDLLTKALQLTASADLVEPGASVTLQVVQKALTSTPQVVTNLVHELPDVKIRGVIPLGALVEAVIGPLAGAISSALPSSTDSVTGKVGDVANLLAEALAIPIAIDVGGRKVTRTLAPLTTDLVTTVTSAPGDAQNLTGAIPIDRFLADFSLGSLSPGVQSSWTVSATPPASNYYMNLSPGLNLLETLLLLPDVVALGSPRDELAPVPVEVRVRLWFDFPQLGLTGVQVDLGPVTLLRLPIVLPQIAAVFRNAFDDWDKDNGQMALLSTDSFGAKLMPSLDAMIRLLSTLSSVLDTFGKGAFEVGMNAQWDNLLVLGQGVRLLVAVLGRLPQNRIYFQPAYETDSDGIDRADLSNRKDQGSSWDNSIRAVIHVGVPAVVDPDTGGVVGRFLRVWDHDDDQEYIDFNDPETDFSYVSILSSLYGAFKDLKQVPPASARSSDDNDDFSGKLEVIEFRSSLTPKS